MSADNDRIDWLTERHGGKVAVSGGFEERFAEFMAKLAKDAYSEPCTGTHSLVTKGGIETVLDIIGGKPKRVLDVGCGQGPALRIFRQLGIEAVGVSLNETDVMVCRDNSFTAERMDQNNLEFEDGSFDFIWARHVLEHSIAPYWTLHEFYRVLKPGGWLYAEMPAPDTVCTHEANLNHYCVLGERAWEFLIGRAGFRPERVLKWEVPTPIGPDIYYGFVAQKTPTVITCLPQLARKQLAEQVKLTADVPGVLAEVGVYKGGSAAIIAESARDVDLHLFDTFNGFPGTKHCEDVDMIPVDSFRDTDFEAVKEKLAMYPNLHFHPGVFPATTYGLDKLLFRFVHLDGDLYETTKAGLEWFYPRMSPGGIILIDDYGREDCPGVIKAVSEFIDGKPEKVEIVGALKARQGRIVKQ